MHYHLLENLQAIAVRFSRYVVQCTQYKCACNALRGIYIIGVEEKRRHSAELHVLTLESHTNARELNNLMGTQTFPVTIFDVSIRTAV